MWIKEGVGIPDNVIPSIIKIELDAAKEKKKIDNLHSNIRIIDPNGESEAEKLCRIYKINTESRSQLAIQNTVKS